MIHREDVELYPGTLVELADAIGDLRYDALAAFLHALAAKLEADGNADLNRGRQKLAAALHAASDSVTSAATEAGRAWVISKPRM